MARRDSKKHIRDRGEGGRYIIYGTHAVRAALMNENRTVTSVLSVKDTISDEIRTLADKRGVAVQITHKGELAEKLGVERADNIVHQGILAEVEPLQYPSLVGFLKRLQDAPHATIVVADRISDPQNIGAIIRNIAAFGGDGLVLPTHHAPNVGGVMAKAAAGALEHVPVLHHTNLVQALEICKKHGFWCYGADERGELQVGECDFPSHCVFVLGSEGEGIRPLVLKNCDATVRIPMNDGIPESLNVASGSAILLFQRYLRL